MKDESRKTEVFLSFSIWVLALQSQKMYFTILLGKGF